MPKPIPYPGGLLLQPHADGTFPKPASGLMLVRETVLACELGALVQWDGTQTNKLTPLDAATGAAKFAGAMIGVQANGVFERRAAVAGETIVVAVPFAEAEVVLGATIAAGAVIKPGAVDGRVEAWVTTNDQCGVLIAGGDEGDRVAAYIHPMSFAVT